MNPSSKSLEARQSVAFPHVDNYRMQGFFRFVLALMVLWSHSIPTFFPEISDNVAKLQLGNVAVSAFFVLSGYLMFEAIAIWYSGRLPQFIANRYLRISPPLFIAAVVSIAIHAVLLRNEVALVGIEAPPPGILTRSDIVISLLDPLFPLNIPIIKLLGLAPGSSGYAFVRYAWAIFTELIFYWMLAAYLATVALLGARIATFTFLLIAVAMFVLGTGTYNGLFGTTFLANAIAKIPLVSHFQWAPHFMIGIMLARYARKPDLPALIILLVACVLAAIQLGLYVRLGVFGALPVLVLYVATLAAGFSMIMANRREYVLGPFHFTAKLDRSFGNLSYPIYINHFALALALLSILYALTGVGLEKVPVLARVALFVVFNLVIVAAAAALIHVTDSLTDRVRDRLRGTSLARPTTGKD